MNVRAKPDTLGERQALAALGQLRLMALWDNLFNQVGISVAQVLLTRNDIADVSGEDQLHIAVTTELISICVLLLLTATPLSECQNHSAYPAVHLSFDSHRQ